MKFALPCVLAFTLCTLHATANSNLYQPVALPADSSLTQSEFIRDAMMNILEAAGVDMSFELKPGKVRNMEAFISHRKKYIIYNPDFINWVDEVTADKWGSIALIAHEMGHHLIGHTKKKSGSKPAVELEADEFAGYILNKLGATLEQSQEVMYYIAGAKASSTHPARADRLAAIRKGWLKAKG